MIDRTTVPLTAKEWDEYILDGDEKIERYEEVNDKIIKIQTQIFYETEYKEIAKATTKE